MKKTIVTLAILSLVILTATGEIFSQNIETLIKNAEVAVEKKDFDGALKLLNTVLAKQPKNAAALTQKARVFYFQRNFTEAVAEADKAIAADPNNSVAYNVRGIAKKDSEKDPNGALADFEKAVALDPKNPKALINRGTMYWNFSKFDLALADINRAIELSPNENYYYTRGAFFHFRKEYDKAAADFTKAIELNPNADNFYGNRAETFLAQTTKLTDATFAQAKADAEKALNLNPQNWRALYVRGMIKYNLRDDNGALTDFLAARKLSPNRPEIEKALERGNWSKTPDNLRFELVEPRLAQYKAEFEKDLSNYDNLTKLEFVFREVPQSVAQSNPAKFTFDGYLNAALKNDPNNPCFNRYRLIRINVASASNEQWRLPQYETDVEKLTNAPTAEKFKTCAAGMWRDVANKRYEIAKRKDSNSFKENFEKSVSSATKANRISGGWGDDILNNLDKLAEEYKDYQLGSLKGDPRNAEYNNRVIGEYAQRKARIRQARAQSKLGDADSTNAFDDSQRKEVADAYVQVIKNDRKIFVIYDDFKKTYEKKYESKSISDRLLDGKKFYMTFSERFRLKQLKTDAETIIADYKNFLAKYKYIIPTFDAEVRAKSVEPPSETINKNIEYWTNELKYIDGELDKSSD